MTVFFKIHVPAVGVGNVALVQNLKENIHDVRVGLLDFVEEQHRIGAAADLLRHLAGLVIAHIARRRTDNTAHRVLLHKFGHIQRIRVSGVSKSSWERTFTSSVLPTPVGPTKIKEAGRRRGAYLHPASAHGRQPQPSRLLPGQSPER